MDPFDYTWELNSEGTGYSIHSIHDHSTINFWSKSQSQVKIAHNFEITKKDSAKSFVSAKPIKIMDQKQQNMF